MAIKSRRVKVSHAYELVADELEAQIISGEVKPGEQLPGEMEIGRLFGVNRSTVREAIRRLENEGLVSRATPRKLVASIPSERKLASRHKRALLMYGVTFQELWEVAVEIEPLAARLAAENASLEDIRELEQIHAQLEQADACGEAAIELDIEFHAKIARAGKNRALLLSREPIGLLLYPAFEALVPHLKQAQKRQIEAHKKILQAIIKRDPETASNWVRKHIEDFGRGYDLSELSRHQPIVSRKTPIV